jgi:hypothetical protein
MRIGTACPNPAGRVSGVGQQSPPLRLDQNRRHVLAIHPDRAGTAAEGDAATVRYPPDFHRGFVTVAAASPHGRMHRIAVAGYRLNTVLPLIGLSLEKSTLADESDDARIGNVHCHTVHKASELACSAIKRDAASGLDHN